MISKILRKKIFPLIAAALFTLGIGGTQFLNATPAYANTTFQGGNFYLDSNTNSPAWVDPVTANVGDIIEFHMEIDNTGAETAQYVKVQATFPANVSGTQLVSTATVTADNASSMTDTATINVNSSSIPSGATISLVYFPGHATLITHPGNVTSSIEQIGTGGVTSIGSLNAGSNVFAEVLFKAQIVANVSPTETPTPTPTITVTPTVTVTPTPTGTIAPTPTTGQGNVVSCPEGFVSVVSGSNIICMQQVNNQSVNVTNNNNNTNNNSATGGSSNNTNNITVKAAAAAAAAPTPAPVASSVPAVTQLPRTGLPMGAWLLSGLLPGGLGIRRLTKRGQGNSDSATYIWQKRDFDK